MIDNTEKKQFSSREMAKYIDHTLLKPEAPKSAYDKLCEEAIEYGFIAVCVNSSWVPMVAERLRSTEIKICSVIGFPLGAMHRESKAFEAKKAIEDGATELDMVMNVGALKSGDFMTVQDDIKAVRIKAEGGVILKVIIETCLLTEEEKIKACEIAKAAGADFVKSSTGFSSGGATIEDISLMRKVVGPNFGVKASGGIKDFEKASEMISAGANRIGAGAGVEIIKGAT